VSSVDERGRITIEKAIREELGIDAGDETVQRVENGSIVIDVVPGRHRRSAFASLGSSGQPPAERPPSAAREPHRRAAEPDRRER
jgi:AbrB family looped-hinge helix DNA binding protein